jgi:hypothetical protein
VSGYARDFESLPPDSNDGLPAGQVAAPDDGLLPSVPDSLAQYVQLTGSDPEQTGLVVLRAARLADVLDDALREDGAGIEVEQLVLDRRAAAVDDEHPPAGHACPWACTAVMATVLMMSGTVQPRERSLTGRRSPCSTGPMATAGADR